MEQQSPTTRSNVMDKTGTYIPNYVKLSDVKHHSELPMRIFDENDPIPDDSSL